MDLEVDPTCEIGGYPARADVALLVGSGSRPIGLVHRIAQRLNLERHRAGAPLQRALPGPVS